MSDTLQKLQWRYATKKFDPTRKLSPEQLECILEAIRLTATSSGRSPMRCWW